MRNFSIEYEKVFNEVDLGIFINDIEGNILSINPKAKNIFLSVFNNSLLNESTSEVSLVKLFLLAKKYFVLNEVIENKKAIHEHKLKYEDEKGNERWFVLNASPIINANGEISEVFNTIIECADASSFNDPIWEITRNINPVLYSTTEDGKKYTIITDSIKKISGYTAEEIFENPVLLIKQINKDCFPDFKEFLVKLKSGKSSVIEYQIKNSNGEVRYLRNSAFPILQEGKLCRIDGIIEDITNEKVIAQKLIESEEKFKILIDTSSDLVFILDSYGYFIMVNTAGASILEYKPEEMIKKHFLEFISEGNKIEVAETFQRFLKSEKTHSFEVVLLSRTKNSLYFEIQVNPIKQNNEKSELLGIGRNVTEHHKAEEKLKELNEKLIEANKIISDERDRVKQQVNILEEVNRLKSEFISNISHELRTPLASIVGFSETISSDPDISMDTVVEFNNIILNEGKRLARLINDFLDFTKIEAGKMDLKKTIFNVVDYLNEIINKIKSFADEKGVIFTYKIPDKEILIFADKERIGRVYNQLLTNAIKFTPRDGKVSLFGQEFDKEFELIVTDTGYGISEKNIRNIFQKFFKVENPGTLNTGTGIGLGLAKQIIELHNGLITVQSEINKGTTFIVKLPKMAATKG